MYLPSSLIAGIAHEANRAYCQQIGDDSQPLWRDAPEWQRESALEGVRKIISGDINSPRESHASWMFHKLADGWTYGAVKDPENKQHPCLVEYDELPLEQRVKDQIFFSIVRALSKVEP